MDPAYIVFIVHPRFVVNASAASSPLGELPLMLEFLG